MAWSLEEDKLQSWDKSKVYTVTWEAASDGSITSVQSDLI